MRIQNVACLLLWSAAVTILSLLRHPPGARALAALPGRDFMGHLGAYAVLCVLAIRAVGTGTFRSRLRVAAAAAAFGVLLELVQPLTGRAFEWSDVLANGLGVAIGLVLAIAVGRVRRTAMP